MPIHVGSPYELDGPARKSTTITGSVRGAQVRTHAILMPINILHTDTLDTRVHNNTPLY